MATFCFDLDDTICFPNHQFCDSETKYAKALPNKDVISFVRQAHQKGHEILIFTARRMLTHNGDIDQIKFDIEDITENWLKKYSVPYNKLIFGKPYADYYIDDKAVQLEHLKLIKL